MRQVSLSTFAGFLFSSVVLVSVTGGCIFSASTSDRDLPEAGEDASTPMDAADVAASDTADKPVDAGMDGAETSRDVVTDVSDEDAAVAENCKYRGLEEGVCSEGIPTDGAGDAGDLVSVDGGQGCRAPETYRSEEAPPEDGDPPFEVCDGLDNDCDGVVDEGCPCDFNQVSEGICGEAKIDPETGQCKPPENYQVDETTCDDGDNDCDGVTDEGCPCIYQSGEMATGVCEQAEKSEEDGSCMEPEDFVDDETDAHCDSKDNDCDGEVDEQCTCNPGETEECYTGPSGSAGTGICESGTRECKAQGTWDSCTGETTPESEESCNGSDDDCDGVVDEGCSCEYDGTSAGVCSDGQIGSEGNCKAPEEYAQDETSCDGVDNDCDGVVDEGCSCEYEGTSTGVCGNATIDPSTGDCTEPADYEETEQSCDDKDNDCDGDVDGDDSDLSCECTSGETANCYTGPSGTEGVGICESGTKTCDSNGSWDSCTGETTTSSEDCNGKDDDCDGVVDEGCSCDYDDLEAGICENQTRDSDGVCPEPSDYQGSESTCTDNLDNDCDGSTDCADSDCAGQACGTGSGAVCENADCVEQNCSDGIDNDKDGLTDCEDPDCSGDACGVGGGGAVCHDNECVETACDDGDNNDEDAAGADENDPDDCRKTGREACQSDSQCVSGVCDSSSGCAQTLAVTSRSFDGDLGGLSGADAKCNDVMSRSLPGNWRAVLSSTRTDVRDRVTVRGEVYNTNGERVASGMSDLWSGTIVSAVGYDETGSSVSDGVWSGSKIDGTAKISGCGTGGNDPCTCNDWNPNDLSLATANNGRSSRKDSRWLDDTDRSCGAQLRLYCIDGQ